MGSAIDKLLVEQIATQNELAICDDMIPVKYNGRPGEPMDAFHLSAKGADYRWFGKRRTASGQWETYPCHPVYVRPDGRAVVPNVPENVAILESFKPQRILRMVPTANGHEQKYVGDHPPLYERIKGSGLSVSLADLSEADQEALAARVLKMMEGATAPKKTEELTPKAKLQGEIQSMHSELAGLRAAAEPDAAAISALEEKIRAAEKNLRKL